MHNNIFFHLLCENDGYSRFMRTYTKIIRSGLIDHIEHIYLNLAGKHKWFFYDQLTNHKLIKTLPRICINNDNESETLNFLRDFSKYNDGLSLYLHSKGVTRIFKENVCKECIQDWIDCMEYFLIEKYDIAIQALEHHDTCGINLKKNSHYSGNFWWAKNTYLRNLPPCKNQYLFCEQNFLKLHLGSNKNLHQTSIGWPAWLKKRYPRNLYTQDEPLV